MPLIVDLYKAFFCPAISLHSVGIQYWLNLTLRYKVRGILGFPSLHNSSFQNLNTGNLCAGLNSDSKHKSFQKLLNPRVHARD